MEKTDPQHQETPREVTDLKSTLMSALMTFLAALAPVFAPWALLWLQLRLVSLRLRLARYARRQAPGVTRLRGHTRGGGSAFPPMPPRAPLGPPRGAPPLPSRRRRGRLGPDPPLSA